MSDTVTVVRKVQVRSLVNPKLREIIGGELREGLTGLNRENEAFNKHREEYVRKCRESETKPDYEIMKRMAMEDERFRSNRGQMEARLQDLEKLQDGDEFLHGTVDSQVEVAVGDNWHSLMAGFEIILEDGLVKEIRKREVQIG